MAAALRRWWLQPSHYAWFSGYLQARGIAGATRTMMAATTASLVLCLIALLVSTDDPRGSASAMMTWLALAGGVVLWSTRWPSHAQSLGFAMVSNTSIALACLTYPDPMASLMGCIAFAISGGYIAFFHTSKYVVYNFAVAAAVASLAAIRMATDGRMTLAAVDLFLVLQVNIALPLSIQILTRAFGNDLMHADEDPLTGLHNRRAFQCQTLGLLKARANPDMYLHLAVIDLDNFKALNDSHGHAAGDRALVAVADALRVSTRATAIIARSGGEEFIVADTAHTSDAVPLAQRICEAISDLSVGVTASVGTVSAPLSGLHDDQYQPLISDLLVAADLAMYRAKRNGGNRVHDHRSRG